MYVNIDDTDACTEIIQKGPAAVKTFNFESYDKDKRPFYFVETADSLDPSSPLDMTRGFLTGPHRSSSITQSNAGTTKAGLVALEQLSPFQKDGERCLETPLAQIRTFTIDAYQSNVVRSNPFHATMARMAQRSLSKRSQLNAIIEGCHRKSDTS
ncbi:hypothetical protein PQX77_000467 [Marasmius sp. AFHP31]|nr:hypothetical protein PQX77_000467 [Marasmius sp. AFHP31]